MISGNAGEWAVPGELEYAIRKDAEIKDFLVREHQFAGEGDDGDGTTCALANDYYVLHIRLTEHIVGRYRIWGSDAWLPDMEVSDDMLLNFLKVRKNFTVETKIFDIPEDDIRRNLPEWDESRTDRREILFGHSARYISREGLEGPFFSDSDEAALMKWLNLTDNKYAQLKDRFLKKLRTEEKQVIFDGLEERAAEFFVHRSYFGGCPGWGSNLKYYYLPWFFPLSMSEQDVINAVREAYEKARRRSRRILPDQYDYTNICGWSRWVNYGIGSCQSIYQGRADDMVIHFLFDFEKMGIVTAYPVYREAQKNPYYHSPDSRDDPFYTEEEWRQ